MTLPPADRDRPHCSVCGGTRFTMRHVLWKELVDQWQLGPDEAAYVDRQQGESCDACWSNLRSIALADAIRAYLGTTLTLRAAAATGAWRHLAILEINEAGALSPVLEALGQRTFAAYPAVDMHAMPYADGSFDLVVHSDTLEHLAQPVRALAECRRVLRQDGALCFTVPTIVARMSRSRAGLPPCWHGTPATGVDDFRVHTEFGADAWTFVMAAGFRRVEIHAVDFPAATALLARRSAETPTE